MIVRKISGDNRSEAGARTHRRELKGGERTSQIVRLYLGMVLLFGLLALLLALPLTWYAVTFFVEFLSFFLNFRPSAVRLTPPVLLLMLATGLLLPLLVTLLQVPLQMHFAWDGALFWLGGLLLIATGASMLPAGQATRLTVRDALAHE